MCCHMQKGTARRARARIDGRRAGRQVCECVVILRNLKDVSWAGAKLMMADTQFLRSLVEFDKDSLSEKQARAPGRRAACRVTPGCLGVRRTVHTSRGARMPGHALSAPRTRSSAGSMADVRMKVWWKALF
jgi:hypothetical protein